MVCTYSSLVNQVPVTQRATASSSSPRTWCLTTKVMGHKLEDVTGLKKSELKNRNKHRKVQLTQHVNQKERYGKTNNR